MLNDIQDRTDVERMVNEFYFKIRAHEILGPIFNEKAGVDWDAHLPKMYRFWSSILLHEQSYTGNPMLVHIQLHQTVPLTEAAFSEWLRLFNENMDELFEGPRASDAKERAANIARLMQYKVERVRSE